MINSHIRDAYAVVEFAAFMENEIKAGKPWTEISAVDKLSELRAKQVCLGGSNCDRGFNFLSVKCGSLLDSRTAD